MEKLEKELEKKLTIWHLCVVITGDVMVVGTVLYGWFHNWAVLEIAAAVVAEIIVYAIYNYFGAHRLKKELEHK